MVKKSATHLDERDLSLEFAAVPVPETVTESNESPIIEVELEPPTEESDKDRQAVKLFEIRIADLEDKFVKLQTELNTLIDKKQKKQRKKREKRESKENKVKCKCKDEKVDIVKCKCKSKDK